MSSNKLNPNFINELFRLSFLKRDVNQIIKNHVEYSYLPDDLRQYKKILKSIKNNNSESLLSFGIVAQQHVNDIDVQEAITSIKESDIVSKDSIIEQLEFFIKNQRNKTLNDRIVQLYNEDRIEEAIEFQAKESAEIVNFSLKNETDSFLKLYGDFEKQQKEKQLEREKFEENHKKLPFGIDLLDDITYGGMDLTDTALWIMRSGVGKSTSLRYTGMQACREGHDVLHIQLEGSEQEVYDHYSEMWTQIDYKSLKNGNISEIQMDKIKKRVEQMNMIGNELFIYSFEKFGSVSMIDIRDLVVDYQKLRGKFPDLVIIDYIGLLVTGENKKLDTDPAYEKKKLNRVAELMKNMAVEFNTRVLTAAQTSDIPFQKWNDPDFVIDRSCTEADRTLAKSFAYIFTGNQTIDERKANLLRIYIDKLRNYKIKQEVVKIKTKFDKGRVYDRSATLKMYEKNEKL